MKLYYIFIPQANRLFTVFYRTGETMDGKMRLFGATAKKGAPLDVSKGEMGREQVEMFHDKGTKQDFIRAVFDVYSRR